MALDFFRITRGLDIQTDDLTSNVNILFGTDAPGGDSGEQDSAPVGSLYLRTSPGSDGLVTYVKNASGSGTDKWATNTTKEYVDALVQGLSWREPVRAHASSNFADISAVETELNDTATPGSLGGVDSDQFVDGDRILVSDLDTGNENVYIVDGTPGSGATLVEDDNSASDGDALLVQEGTDAETQWVYDGTSWILMFAAGQTAEFGNIRDFIGKDASGTELPDYPSNNVISDSSNLEYEIGHLDDAVGTLSFTTPNVLTDYSATFGTSDSTGTAATDNITTNLQAIDDQFGDGVITNTGAEWALSGDLNWNGGTLTLTSAFDEINETIGDLTFTEDNLITTGNTIASNLDVIDTQFGSIDDSASYTTGGFIDETTIASNDLQENLDSFNQEIGSLSEQQTSSTFTAVASATTLDTIAVSDFNEIIWHVQYKVNGSSERQSYMVHALTDGSTVDYTTYAKLALNGSVGNTGDDVVINGSNIEFNIDPNSSLDVTIKRVSVSKLS